MVKSKIHRAEVTDRSLNYEGSLAIAADLMKEVNLHPYERILVGNMANGQRFETYAIEAPAGSGTISLNGGTAHLGGKGDLLTIMSFGFFREDEVAGHRPKVIVLADHNTRIIRKGKK
ncbi:MAG: aspartate 1-decarboxylase [Opitutaceae bacterium]